MANGRSLSEMTPEQRARTRKRNREDYLRLKANKKKYAKKIARQLKNYHAHKKVTDYYDPDKKKDHYERCILCGTTLSEYEQQCNCAVGDLYCRCWRKWVAKRKEENINRQNA